MKSLRPRESVTQTEIHLALGRIESKLEQIERHNQDLIVLLDFSQKRLQAERKRRIELEHKLKRHTKREKDYRSLRRKRKVA